MAYAKSGKQIGDAKAKLGSGERFNQIGGTVAAEYEKKGVNPKKAAQIGAAVAAKAGREKYGAKKFNGLAKAGRKRAEA